MFTSDRDMGFGSGSSLVSAEEFAYGYMKALLGPGWARAWARPSQNWPMRVGPVPVFFYEPGLRLEPVQSSGPGLNQQACLGDQLVGKYIYTRIYIHVHVCIYMSMCVYIYWYTCAYISVTCVCICNGLHAIIT